MFEILVSTTKGTKVAHVRCDEKICSLGKSKQSLIALQGWKIAPIHTLLVNEPNGVHVVDQGSRLGTIVNKEKIDRFGPISANDVIRIGDYVIRVKPENKKNGSAEAPAAQPHTSSAIAERPHARQENTAATRVDPHPGKPAADARQTPETQRLAMEWRSKIHSRIFEIMDLRRINVNEMGDEELREFTQQAINDILKNLKDFPDSLSKSAIAKQVLDEAVGLGPLEELLADDEISEIMVNAHDEIFYEKAGRLVKSDIVFTDDNAVIGAIERIVAPLGRRIDESSPLVDARLKDGSRVNAIIPPLAIKGPSVTIRKFMKERLTSLHLIDFGSVCREMMEFLEVCIMQRKNIIISGGTGSGKTTLLNVLSNFIPETERIVTVEDAAELRLYQPNLVSLEARPPNQEGKGVVSIRDLVKNCLRMRPDRIVVGECRGGEALDMLQAMNTGHDGSLTTIHANSPRDCISRLEVLVLMSGMDLPVNAIREQIASAVDIIVQQTRFACGSRKITSVSEVSGVESGTVQLGEIFRYVQSGYDENGKISGRFGATGQVPDFYTDLRKRGIDVDINLFAADKVLN